VETLNRPSEKHARELGTIQLAGKLPSEAYIFALINHKACEMGANAIMIKHLEEQRGAGGIDYQATVAAFANDESAIPPESFASTPSPQTQPTHIESGGPVETQPAQVGDTPAPGEPHATSPSGLEPNVESPAVSAR